MFEIRLRILDVRERDTDPNSFLGIVEGFPEILVCASTIEQAERDLVSALEEHLRRLMDHEATRIPLDDFPTVWLARLCLILHASSEGALREVSRPGRARVGRSGR